MYDLSSSVEVSAMLRITISGAAGSGTTTLAERLCQHFDWDHLNGGMVFREQAQNRQMDLVSFAELCDHDQSVDRSLDSELKLRMGGPDGPEVVESRLAGWWSHQLGMAGIRLWLAVSLEERARRVVLREGGDVSQRKSEIESREHRDRSRFLSLYDLDPANTTPYTHILESDDMLIEEVLSSVITMIEEDGG